MITIQPMSRSLRHKVFGPFFLTCLFLFNACLFAGTRPARFAGSFYPADPKELAAIIRQYLEGVPETKLEGDLFGIIVPHAGYVYSGTTAAAGYALLKTSRPDTVILIGPSHFVPFDGAAIWQKGDWVTPLGSVAVDESLARAIAEANPLFQFSHGAHLKEHALEVELPFLQTVLLYEFKIVPILLGNLSLKHAKSLAEALLKYTRNRNVLFVASTDMSHYFPENIARQKDQLTLSLIENGNPDQLWSALEEEKGELCGAAAVLTLLEVAKRVPDLKFEKLGYSHSGEVSGDFSRVVGYGAFALMKARPNRTPPDPAAGLSREDQKEIIRLAKESIAAKVQGKAMPSYEPFSKALRQPKGVFVTLRKHGKLRGCIGNTFANKPIYSAVQDNAVAAALHDARFPAVSAEELSELQIEVSVLSPPQKIQAIDEFELKTHGMILESEGRTGVFLPEVAAETGWTKDQWMDELCSQKLELPADCWKNSSARMSVFISEKIG